MKASLARLERFYLRLFNDSFGRGRNVVTPVFFIQEMLEIGRLFGYHSKVHSKVVHEERNRR